MSTATASPPTRTTSRLMRATLVVAALLLLAALATPMFVGHVYVGDDLGAFHLPLRAFYAEQLAAEQSFDWWPQLFTGFYATGEGQLGGYHPLHLALYKYLPLSTAFNLEVFLSYPLMLLGMFFWLRRLFRRATPALFGAPALIGAPALFGAIVFAFSGFNLLHLFHVNAVAVVAHIPWLLLAIDVLWKNEGRRAAAWAWLSIAMLTGSQILLGYPQYVWFSLLAEAAYVLYLRTASCWPWRTLLTLARAKGVGLLLGGLQLLPTFDALQNSVRQSADAGFAESYSLHPLNLVQLVAPYLFESRVVGQNTHALGLYAGAVPLMLMVYLFTRRRNLGRLRPLAIAATCFGVFAILMALGKFGFLYQLQTWLPVVGNFRAPCRMIVLFHLSMAVLSAIALCHLARKSKRSTDGNDWRPYLAVVGLSLALVPVAMLLWPNHLATLPQLLAGPLLLAAAAGLVVLASRRASWAMAALVLFCAADLGSYGMSYSVWQRTAKLDQFVASAAEPDQSEKKTDYRVARHLPVQGSPQRVGNAVTLAGYDRIHGYSGLEPARRLDYRDPRVWQLAGVGLAHRDVLVRGATSTATPEKRNGNYQLAPFEPLPRFRFVRDVRTSQYPGLDIHQIDIGTTALVDVPLDLPSAGQQPESQRATGTAHVIHDLPGAIQLRTSSASSQLLVTNEAFHPGWQISVDGRPARVPAVRVNGDFLGAVIPAGDHRVVLQFSPRSLELGRLVSACGLGLLGSGFLMLRFRRAPSISTDETSCKSP